ncbi:iron-containing alcohol dehydrogenase [Chlorobaculum parvum NCIB 8327]|uniref:Iron-containing alcohol dehydrogenase n=1 Tax=Chlorobaculum parvum (strain DSM 263 / NCIMB 8327) TaxID=517417 RepID=B3QNS1_CHLP8|nr:iron-containing alcohol dehydrogenase [Chlorobaculum parvum]ACF11574.1 iron-containing alcohol dehydrogenase [Chlorobaculum parvum NCIB 8327]
MSSEQNLDFSILPLPRIHFGAGKLSCLPSSVSAYGRTLLLVTGRSTLRRSEAASGLLEEFHRSGIEVELLEVAGEPSPELIDHAVELGRKRPFDAVAAIGGGSVLDAGKAISGMLLQHHSVERFIEGRPGVLLHDGRKVPFIAVPTTSGTGSEVTNNSVISRVGPGGFKRSLRHPAFVPDVAIIDPELMVSLPREVTVSTGMDAFTQLLEAYLSPFASAYTDALCCSGLEHFARSFEAASGDGAASVAVRADMAYAALMSGIALANAGLGIVHGFASSVGGLFDIPHGTLCATLLAEATRENIRQLQAKGEPSVGLSKFANAARILTGKSFSSEAEACEQLVAKLEAWQEQFAFPRLGEFGMSEEDFEEIIATTRSKSNAAPLDAAAMRRILAARV